MTEPEEKESIDSVYDGDEINLRELFDTLWNGKILIIALTAVVALSSIYISLSITNYYTSQSVLVVRDSKDTAAIPQLTGMASLVGMDLSGSSGNTEFEVMEIIGSREFVRHLITFEDVLPSLMAAKSYDLSSQELYFDPEVYDGETKTWIREAPPNKKVEPSYLEAYTRYGEILSIDKDKVTGLISIQIEHISPVFAKDFLTLIIQEANNANREMDITDSSKAINYLKNELSLTPQKEIQESIGKLLENQLETRMMASIYDDYVLITLEPPFIPEMKSGPIRSLIVIFSTLVGGLLSVMIVLVRRYF